VPAAERPLEPTNYLAEEDVMNVEVTELKAIEEATQADDSIELFALSIDDLDLVGGGAVIGLVT
jgi:hypothetical protein